MKILVTGGSVHAKIDAVKFITNRFKGGLMAKLAYDLVQLRKGVEVVYLCSDGSKKPPTSTFTAPGWVIEGSLETVYHDGFHDYQQKVIEMAPDFDAVVLGAAVANLIPVRYFKKYSEDEVTDITLYGTRTPAHPNSIKMPLRDKFPSHDYKPGDSIFMEWQIAPRIIDEVRSAMKPGAHLFGFKLLSGVPQDELTAAAYGIILESKATCVFANDTDDLDRIYAVMKDRSVHPMQRFDMSDLVLKLIQDEYFSTATGVKSTATLPVHERRDALVAKYKKDFVEVEEGYIFGTVAVRAGTGPAFLTTERGKRELDGKVYVTDVDFDHHYVYTGGGKATLNAPLLYRIFDLNPDVDTIVHCHKQQTDMPTYPYAPPGTVRDADRTGHTSFNIKNHGCFLLLNKEGKQL